MDSTLTTLQFPSHIILIQLDLAPQLCVEIQGTGVTLFHDAFWVIVAICTVFTVLISINYL